MEQHGEGLHHLAFNVKGMQVNIGNFEKWGMKLIRKGEYRRGDGRYAFLDASALRNKTFCPGGKSVSWQPGALLYAKARRNPGKGGENSLHLLL